jgi:hypothetical protein
MTCTFNFGPRFAELEAALPLKPIERRLIDRLRAQLGSGPEDAETWVFLKAILRDPEADAAAVMDSLSDLVDTGVVELRVLNTPRFRVELALAVSELDTEMAKVTHG